MFHEFILCLTPQIHQPRLSYQNRLRCPQSLSPNCEKVFSDNYGHTISLSSYAIMTGIEAATTTTTLCPVKVKFSSFVTDGDIFTANISSSGAPRDRNVRHKKSIQDLEVCLLFADPIA